MSNDIRVELVKDPEQKTKIAREILESLLEWFEVEESREGYIKGSAEQTMVVAWDGETPAGFLCLKETGKDTTGIEVMGVKKEYHRHGVGRKLFELAKEIAKSEGYSFMQVKTVQMGYYEDYDRTNRFYLGVGFKELEVIPVIWGEENPCQIYVMAL